MPIKSENNMGTPFFLEFKKQASFYLKEKLKTARLALTDVTPAELLAEEATNGNPWAPDTRTMAIISRAAFEVDDYWRIVEILHKRLVRFDRNNWRVSYKALIILEHLLTHGPESVSEEFQNDRDVIHGMESFQYIDEKGFNWGLTVRKKSERVQKLLERGPLLKEERDRSRKISRGIEGFGSFCNRSYTGDGNLREPSFATFGRANSNFNEHEKDQFLFLDAGSTNQNESTLLNHGNSDLYMQTKVQGKWDSSNKTTNLDISESQKSLKVNIIPAEDHFPGKLSEFECIRESNPLLSGEKDETEIVYSEEEDHPFNIHKQYSTSSLLSTGDEIL
ncbi:hypothetical protein IFM89_000165 [Coptis chinensis]|uniref:ENTH domain-containing protein n=1 Tax=Coptis chinensis TaxID=261450 RepID=A0A835H0P7_9MAGN|nr:hypothetical protein IFM89_000165 [Coptis chinensis]